MLNFLDFSLILRNIFPSTFPCYIVFQKLYAYRLSVGELGSPVCQIIVREYYLSDTPLVSVSPEKVTIAEGNKLLLTCNASGEPEPSISWTRIGSSNVLSVSPSLTIVNVSRPRTEDNMIQYQCTVSNGVGTPATATVYVTVVCKYSSIRCTVTVFWRVLNSSNFCTTCSRNR